MSNATTITIANTITTTGATATAIATTTTAIMTIIDPTLRAPSRRRIDASVAAVTDRVLDGCSVGVPARVMQNRTTTQTSDAQMAVAVHRDEMVFNSYATGSKRALDLRTQGPPAAFDLQRATYVGDRFTARSVVTRVTHVYAFFA